MRRPPNVIMTALAALALSALPGSIYAQDDVPTVAVLDFTSNTSGHK